MIERTIDQFIDIVSLLKFTSRCIANTLTAFVKALFPTSSQNNELDSHFIDLDENFMKWPKSIANEVKNSIKTFNSKKACGSDGINFHIIQKAYGKISKLFDFFYIHLIDQGYHPRI